MPGFRRARGHAIPVLNVFDANAAIADRSDFAGFVDAPDSL
jgi:hypothetical protein